MLGWLTEDTSLVRCRSTIPALDNQLYTVRYPRLHVDNVHQDIEKPRASFRQREVILVLATKKYGITSAETVGTRQSQLGSCQLMKKVRRSQQQ